MFIRETESILDKSYVLEESPDLFNNEEMKNYFEKLKIKNYSRKIDRIPNLDATSENGQTLIHLVLTISSITDDVPFCITVLQKLSHQRTNYKVKDKFGLHPIHYAIEIDSEDILSWFLTLDGTIDTKFKSKDFTLMHYAALRKSPRSLEVLHKCDRTMVNRILIRDQSEKLNGFTPLNICLDFNKNFDEDFKKSVQFLIEKTDSKAYYTTNRGTVLHELMKADHLDGIKSLLSKLENEGKGQSTDELTQKRDVDDQDSGSIVEGPGGILNTDFGTTLPLIWALENKQTDFRMAIMLLQFGADPNVQLRLNDRKGTIVSAIEFVISITIGKYDAMTKEPLPILPIATELLSRMNELPEKLFASVLKQILENPCNFNFELFQLLIEKGNHCNLDVNRLIVENDEFVIHTLMEAFHIEDIHEPLMYLLNLGINPMTRDKYTGMYPIERITKQRYSYDTKDLIADVRKVKEGCHAEKRLPQYLKCLLEFGLSRLFEEQTNPETLETYKIEFVKYHLVPAIYASNHEFLGELLHLFYTFPEQVQWDFLHFTTIIEGQKSERQVQKSLDWLEAENEATSDVKELQNNLAKNPEQNHEPFTHSPLYWATKNGQEIIMQDIVKAEFHTHRLKPKEGLQYFEKIPPNHLLRKTAIDYYQDLSGKSISWIGVLLQALLAVLVVQYGLFALDIYSDIQLIMAFKNQSLPLANTTQTELESFVAKLGETYEEFRNLTQYERLKSVQMRDDISELGIDEVKMKLLQDQPNYDIAIFAGICLIIPSLLGYLLTTWFYFQMPENCLKFNNRYLKSIFSILKPRNKYIQHITYIFNPLVYIPCHIRCQYLTLYDPNNRSKALMFQYCNDIWTSIRRIEVCIETITQLILQLWIFDPYILVIQEWSFWTFAGHIYVGFGGIFGLANATFVELMVGKFFLATVMAVFGISKLKVEKGSRSVFSMAGGCYGMATLFHLVARCMTLHLLFSTNMTKLWYFGCILIHLTMELLLKLLEFKLTNCTGQIKCSKSRFKDKICLVVNVLASSICGILVFNGIERDSRDRTTKTKNTFLPCFIHYGLCYFQHMMLALFCWDGEGATFVFSFVPPSFLTLSAIFRLCYYKYYHLESPFDAMGPECLKNSRKKLKNMFSKDDRLDGNEMVKFLSETNGDLPQTFQHNSTELVEISTIENSPTTSNHLKNDSTIKQPINQNNVESVIEKHNNVSKMIAKFESAQEIVTNGTHVQDYSEELTENPDPDPPLEITQAQVHTPQNGRSHIKQQNGKLKRLHNGNTQNGDVQTHQPQNNHAFECKESIEE